MPTSIPSAEQDFEHAKKLVEDTLRKLGLDPAAMHANAGGSNSQAAWTLKRGSASVLVTVTHRADEKASYLRVAAPVVVLPADAARHQALFRHLLELNAAGLANAAFALAGDKVIVVCERPTPGLGAEEVEQSIRHLAAVADTFDDRLEKEYGATRP
jgi:hypothetical protein